MSRPLSGKVSYDRARSPDRLQNNNMLPFHATNRKMAFISHGLAAGANRKKLPLDFFCKNCLCNSNGSFSHQLFLNSYHYLRHLYCHYYERLALINYHLIYLTFKSYV